MIRMVRVEGLWLIGTLEGNVLKSVRGIIIRQDGQMVITPLPGGPKDAVIPIESSLIYEPTDDGDVRGLVSVYRRDVSGLVLAKTMPPNMVEMPRGQQ